jgi:hypothetical protein
MGETEPANQFYLNTQRHSTFASLADATHYSSLPDDWWIGTSDIAGSTQAVANGRYKCVNMIAAAVISAQINAHKGSDFPYIFGGDGAGFAVPPEWKEKSERALAAVRTWAREEFGLELRIGMMPMIDIRKAGFDVAVARFGASECVDYAMFTGGGLSWAENHMKAVQNSIVEAGPGSRPDLTGLSCRWNHMPSRNGAILSLVILPTESTTGPAFSSIASQIAEIVARLERSGHPAEVTGPGASWPPKGAALEAHAQRGNGSLTKARCKALFESLVAWILIKTGLKIGGFDARRYQKIVGNNADFRKFEDGLKMTLDCDADTEQQLRDLLDQGAANGAIRYGIHKQSEAMMTCIVPSILTDDHVHFVDGASGGYTEAARTLKAR